MDDGPHILGVLSNVERALVLGCDVDKAIAVE